jgi:hypothetical protein
MTYVLHSKESKLARERAGNDVVDAVVNLDSEIHHDDPYTRRQPSNGLLSSSKPTILPANALRLHLDDPAAPLTTPHDPVHPPPDTSNEHLRHSRVRFRSRVRITSGFSHHRRRSDVGSSRSGSPSSSISAPLRSHSDDGTNSWGTLGQRVGLLALQKRILGLPKAKRRQKGLVVPSIYVDERTPLRNSFNNSPYVAGEGVQEGVVFDEDSDDERLSQEVDDVFGKFPGRLLNYHVSSFAVAIHHIPLIIMGISGGTGSLNQSYVVITLPTLNDCIAPHRFVTPLYLLFNIWL